MLIEEKEAQLHQLQKTNAAASVIARCSSIVNFLKDQLSKVEKKIATEPGYFFVLLLISTSCSCHFIFVSSTWFLFFLWTTDATDPTPASTSAAATSTAACPAVASATAVAKPKKAVAKKNPKKPDSDKKACADDAEGDDVPEKPDEIDAELSANRPAEPSRYPWDEDLMRSLVSAYRSQAELPQNLACTNSKKQLKDKAWRLLWRDFLLSNPSTPYITWEKLKSKWGRMSKRYRDTWEWCLTNEMKSGMAGREPGQNWFSYFSSFERRNVTLSQGWQEKSIDADLQTEYAGDMDYLLCGGMATGRDMRAAGDISFALKESEEIIDEDDQDLPDVGLAARPQSVCPSPRSFQSPLPMRSAQLTASASASAAVSPLAATTTTMATAPQLDRQQVASTPKRAKNAPLHATRPSPKPSVSLFSGNSFSAASSAPASTRPAPISTRHRPKSNTTDKLLAGINAMFDKSESEAKQHRKIMHQYFCQDRHPSQAQMPPSPWLQSYAWSPWSSSSWSPPWMSWGAGPNWPAPPGPYQPAGPNWPHSGDHDRGWDQHVAHEPSCRTPDSRSHSSDRQYDPCSRDRSSSDRQYDPYSRDWSSSDRQYRESWDERRHSPTQEYDDEAMDTWAEREELDVAESPALTTIAGSGMQECSPGPAPLKADAETLTSPAASATRPLAAMPTIPTMPIMPTMPEPAAAVTAAATGAVTAAATAVVTAATAAEVAPAMEPATEPAEPATAVAEP